MISDIVRKLNESEHLSDTERAELTNTLLAYSRTANMGMLNQGRFVRLEFISPNDTSTSTNPLDEGFTGAFQSGRGFTWSSGTYQLGTVKSGQIAAGFSTLGYLLFMNGAGYADETGLHMDGLTFPLVFTATNSGNARRVRIGMIVPDGETIPAWQIRFEDNANGTNLITSNPGAESGDLTGWTSATYSGGVTDTWTADTGQKYAGSYSFRYNCPATSLAEYGTLTSNKYTITAGNSYSVSVMVYRTLGTATIKLHWYTSGDVLVSTETIASGVAPSSWTSYGGTFIAPATSAKFALELRSDVTLDPITTDYYANVYFDDASVSLSATPSIITFKDGKIYVTDDDATWRLFRHKYASIYGNEIAWTASNAVQNTWYTISDADMTDGVLYGMTHDGSGKITVSKAGKYLVQYDLSVSCGTASKHIQCGISVSGTVSDAGINHVVNGTTGIEYPLGGNTILSLAANATIEIAIRHTDTGTPDISVDHLNVSITQLEE